MLLKILVGVVAAILLIVALAVAAPFFIPLDTVKSQISSQVRDATGRDLTIQGAIKLSLLPRIEVEIGDVAFANPRGSSTPFMAKVTKLQLQVKLMPLIRGEVAIDSFVVVNPEIRLEIDKQGRPNWQFATPATDRPAGPADRGQAERQAMALGDLKLGDIRLVNGAIGYRDARTGSAHEITQVNLKLSLPDLDSRMQASGDLTWNGKKIDLTLDLAKPRQVLAGQRSDLALKVGGDMVRFDYRGTLADALAPRVDGEIDLDVPSVRDLAGWMGEPIAADANGFGPLRVKGKIAATTKQAAFTGAQINFDAIKAQGDLSVDAGGAKPHIKAKLDVERLDLNPYIPAAKSADQPVSPRAGPSAAAPAGASLSSPAAVGDWSDEPIDLRGLRIANADLQLVLGALVVRKIEIGRGVVAVRLMDGKLTADLAELALYGGQGKGRLVVDGSGAVPAIEQSLTLSRIQAQPLLRAAADFDRLTGTAAGDIALATKGRSQRELVGALQGQGAVTFNDGAIRGVNIGAMARNVATAFLDASAGATQQTDFAELSGSFTMANGVARNTDLALKSPLLRVTGAGVVDLPRRLVDYRLEPQLALTTEGQGAAQAAPGLMVPVIVKGPWDSPSYKPDLGNLVKQRLKDPGKALESLKSVLPGLTKPAAPPAGGSAAPAPVDPAATIKRLFGGGKN